MDRVIKGLIYFFLFTTIAILFAAITLFILEKREPLVDVPDLYGKDIVSAKGILGKKRLKMKKSFSFHKTIPKDYVIDQIPKPHKQVKPYSTVEVIISLGMPDIHIPEIIGKDLYSCKILLSKKGLALGNITYIYSDKPKGTVLDFSSEGKGIKEGDRINLLVSRGKRVDSFLMPDLLGLNLEAASSTLKAYNLILKDTLLEPGTEGVILKQKPPPGTRINEGESVEITLGIGND